MPTQIKERGAESGLTLGELLVVVALLGLIVSFVVWQNKDVISGGLATGTDQIRSVTKIARTYAMSTTTPHRIVPTSDTTLQIQWGGPCDDGSATWTPVDGEDFELPRGTNLSSTGWDVCFTTRGWATSEHDLVLREGSSFRELKILLGGSVTSGEIHR